MQYDFLISIVVPTKNRAEYAYNTAKQVLALNDSRIQLVIQDNSDTNSLETLLNPSEVDKRLKYNYSPGTLSFVDNFSKAVSLAEGEYICIIGDDDGINPEIIKLVEWASKKKIKAIKPEVQAVYFWPDAINNTNRHIQNGYLEISNITANVRTSETNNQLIKLLENGGQNYLALDLVKLYHGIVRREYLEKIFERTGKYFGGLSPDIYSSVALSIAISEVISIDYPITISGICNKSGSADSATGRHTGDLEDAPHFIGHSNYEWSNMVPPFYSVETIWADSALAAIREMNKPDLIDRFCVEKLTINCIRKYSNYKKVILDHYFDVMKRTRFKKLVKIKMNIAIQRIITINFIKRSIKKIRKKRNVIQICNINNIEEAQKEFSKYLNTKELSIEQVIKNIES